MKAKRALTSSQKAKLLKHLPLGGDRATVCKFVGATLAQLHAEMKRDPDFAQAVVQAEAAVDLKHFGNVQKASQDEKNWRTSVWWLERRARQQSSDADPLANPSLMELLDELALAITAEVKDEELQRRVIERLLESLAKRDELAAHSLARQQDLACHPTDTADVEKV
jgi:hypothetical protein